MGEFYTFYVVKKTLEYNMNIEKDVVMFSPIYRALFRAKPF